MSDSQPAIRIDRLTHRYGQRVALDDLSLSIGSGELFALLGPNGSGKTTLFRILSTLIAPTDSQSVRIFGHGLLSERQAVRRLIGVVFQSPSLDKQLTATENLRHHGYLYGLRGSSLTSKITTVLAAAGLSDRADERTGTFSGGMRRRVELAKGLLTSPRLLLLDEPSTGLDPAARIDLWQTILRVRQDMGVTVMLTTHLMDEADRCDRLAIVRQGKLLACDSPAALKTRYVGGDVVNIVVTEIDSTQRRLREQLGIDTTVVANALRFESNDAAALIPRIAETLPAGSIDSISIGRPTLEDVFVRLTGGRFSPTSN